MLFIAFFLMDMNNKRITVQIYYWELIKLEESYKVDMCNIVI